METELAYLAGAIDSDGTIGIKRSTYAMRVRKDAGSAVFSERVALRQTSPIVPTMLKERFGGSLYMTKPSAARGRPLYSWAATDQRAIECLRALLPFLRIKRDQALNCLELRVLKEKSMKAKVSRGRGHAGAAPRPLELTEAMEVTYARAKALNVVGTQ
jgi:hypothetical protein